MKPTLFLLAALLGAHGLFAQKPVLHLRMDDERSRQISDQSGRKNHAQMVGGLAFVQDRFGQDCRALQFDGRGYLTVAHDRSLNLNRNFSLTVWVYLPASNVYQGIEWLTLICKGEDPIETDFSPAYRVQLTAVTASVNTASTKSIGSVQQYFPIGRWMHVASVYDGQVLRIYRDGQEVNRFALQDPIYVNQEPLNIGRDIPGNEELFRGTMDDLRVFDQALSAAAVKAIFEDDSDKTLGSGCPAPPVAVNSPAPNRPPGDVPNWGGMKPRQPAQPAQPSQPQPPVVPPPATPPAPQPVEPVQTLPPPPADPRVSAPAPRPAAPEDPYTLEGYAPNNLVLLLDVSGSMNYPNKLPLLKEAFLTLVPHMRAEDQVSVVTYSGGTSVLLSGVPATEQATIEAAIENLYSKGKTRGKKGLKKAYKLAQQHFIPNGNNRIILATDGVFQLGELFPLAESMAGNDIALSVFSFGVNESRKQYQLDELARLGEGRHTAILPDNVEARLLEEVRGRFGE